MARRNIEKDVEYYLSRCSLEEKEIYETLQYMNSEAERILGQETAEELPKDSEKAEKEEKKGNSEEHLYPLSLIIDELKGELEEQELFKMTMNQVIDIRINALIEKINFLKRKSKK